MASRTTPTTNQTTATVTSDVTLRPGAALAGLARGRERRGYGPDAVPDARLDVSPQVEEPTMPVPGAVTDPEAVTTSRVQLDSGGDKIDAYLARPAQDAGRHGGVIVI